MERYRSGHNGADSKSVWEQSHVGSNPTRSANLIYLKKGVLILGTLCNKSKGEHFETLFLLWCYGFEQNC